MAFQTSKEQSKWDALQASSSATIDKILQGAATPDDIKNLSRVIAQLNQLAGAVFDGGIADAEATADTIVDRLNRERIASGKRPLTQKAFERVHKQTLQSVIQANSTDILGAVHDELQKHSADVADRIDHAFERHRRLEQSRREEESRTNRVGDRVQQTAGSSESRLRRVATPATRDINPEEAAENASSPDSNPSAARSSMGISTFIRSTLTAMRNATVEGWQNLTSGKKDDEESRASIWLRKMKGIYGDFKKKGKATKNILSKIFGPMGKLLLLALTSPQLIQTITKAVSEYLNFDSVSAFLGTTWKEIKETGSDVMDWIVKKVKELFTGNKDAQRKAANSANTDEGRAAISASISKDSQIPANTSVAQARAAIPEIEGRLKARKVALSKAQARLAKDPSDQNKISVRNNTIAVQILQGQLDNYRKVLGKPTSNVLDIKAPPPVAVDAPQVENASASPADQSKSGRTSVVAPTLSGPSPAAVLDASSASTKATGSYPQMTDGTILPAATEPPVATPVPQDRVAAGGGIVSLRSFGFQSADDSLNILNMRMIG